MRALFKLIPCGTAAALAACAADPADLSVVAGLSYSPGGPAHGASFPLAGQIGKLIADPRGGFLYALDQGSPSQIVVIDTAQKLEVGRVTLPQLATDLDISPDGAYLVASHDAAHSISVIDAAGLRVTATVPTASDPYAVEVTSNGTAYYIERDQWVSVRRIGLGGGGDTLLSSTYQGDAELSADGAFLYVGESGTSGGDLRKYNISGGGMTQVDHSTWENGYGFWFPRRQLYLPPGGKHIYYAGYQLDAQKLAFVRGHTGELVFAEDARGTFAIGENHIFDAELVRPVASLPHRASAAVLTAADSELWYYSPDTGQLYDVDPSELIDRARLGQREVRPGPLKSYSFVKLIHDPVRPRLYGLDAAQGVVVVIDAETLEPTRAILVGTIPTDLDIDPAGGTLFVGHLDALAFSRIGLETLTFGGLVLSPRTTLRVAALGHDRLVTIDDSQWTNLTLVDATTGQVLTETDPVVYQGALGAAADGATIFLGESEIYSSYVVRYAVIADRLVRMAESRYKYYSPTRSITALPDASGVYYGDALLDGGNLNIERYPVYGTILAVTPDGRLALTAEDIYNNAPREPSYLGPLPVTAQAIAIRPDGRLAFLAADGDIVPVDLSGY